jgi:uncharacterized protein (DUF433 family)
LAASRSSAGTRLAVDFLLDLLAAGWSEAKLLDQYRQLRPDDIRACLELRDQRSR